MENKKPLLVRLTPTEMKLSILVARKSDEERVRGRFKEKADGTVESIICGIMAERAVSIAFNIPRNEGLQARADLGSFIDVKTSRHPRARFLIVNTDKPIENAYVFVDASRRPVFEIKGWAWGADFMKNEYVYRTGTVNAFPGQKIDVFGYPLEKLRPWWELSYQILKRKENRGPAQLKGKWGEQYDRDLARGYGCVDLSLGLAYAAELEPCLSDGAKREKI